jgi:hypothetical protein
VRTLQEIRREYGRPLLVPMTLVDPQYLDEIFGSLHMAGEDVRHFFLSLEVVESHRRFVIMSLIGSSLSVQSWPTLTPGARAP